MQVVDTIKVIININASFYFTHISFLQGLENIHMPSVDALSTDDSDVLCIGYLGVDIKHPYTQKEIHIQEQKNNNHTEQVIHFLPTQAFQLIRIEYSQLSSRTDSDSSLEQEFQPELSLSHKDSVLHTQSENCHGKPIEVLLPKKAINPLHWFQLDSTGSDCTSLGSVSIDADWSDSSEEENSKSVFNSYTCIDSEERLTNSDSNKVEEVPKTRFVDMDDAAVHYGFDSVQNITKSNAIDHALENTRRIMKVQTLTDLNNENHYAKRQNTESLNSILSNVFENDLEGKRCYKENNIMSSGNFSNGISDGNISNLKQTRCTKRTNSDDTVLDMQKYVIQKENIYNKNNYNIKSWNVKCFDCKTVKANSKLDSLASSPESVTPYPLDGLYKKRQNVETRTHANIVSLTSILCGCVNSKTKSAKKFRKTTKNFGGRFPAVGLSLRK